MRQKRIFLLRIRQNLFVGIQQEDSIELKAACFEEAEHLEPPDRYSFEGNMDRCDIFPQEKEVAGM